MTLSPPPFLARPFADRGDRNAIPDMSETPGAANLVEGFPPITQTPLRQGGKPPTRVDMNGILNLLSLFAFWQQSGGMAEWNKDCDYMPPAIVYSNGVWYVPKQPSGPSYGGAKPVTNTTYWGRLDAESLAAALAAQSSANTAQAAADAAKSTANLAQAKADTALASASNASSLASSHAARHASGGADAVTPAAIGAAPANATLTNAAGSGTLPATTSTALGALLQTTRNCLKWLIGKFPVSIADGGTGASTARSALTALGGVPSVPLSPPVGSDLDEEAMWVPGSFWYCTANNTANRPDGINGFCLVLGSPGGYGKQLYFRTSNTEATSWTYVRTRYYGNPVYTSSWARLDTVDATTTVSGIVALATNAEAQAGTNATRAVTPAALKSAMAAGNVAGADKLATPRTIALSGRVTGTDTAFDGSKNISIPVTAVTADSCTGNAASASKLAAGRYIRTDLASTTALLFDGTSPITPGVTGTLAIGNGGTGAVSAVAALANLFGLQGFATGAPAGSNLNDNAMWECGRLWWCNASNVANRPDDLNGLCLCIGNSSYAKQFYFVGSISNATSTNFYWRTRYTGGSTPYVSPWARALTASSTSLTSRGNEFVPGLIYKQWGSTTVMGTGAEVNVTFREAFPNACLHVFPTIYNKQSQAISAYAYAYTTTGCTVGSVGASSTQRTISWLALGY